MLKLTGLEIVIALLLVWNTFFRAKPTGPFAAVQAQMSSFYDALNSLSLLGFAILGLVLIWAWPRALRDRRATRAAFESRAQLAALTPEQFERWCAARLEAMAYRVTNVAGQGDHGVDLIAAKDGEKVVVQCKRYTGARQVGEPQVRDLYGAMHHYEANRAIVITAGTFTDQARAWVQEKAIELWDIDRLAQIAAPAKGPAAVPVTVAPNCERCGAPMQVRRNRSTGDIFYGCSTYPRCRYTRPA